MKLGTMTVAGVGVCVLALAATAADTPAMSVFITSAKVEPRPKVDGATKNALKKTRDDAEKARKAREKELKKELGKERDAWPEDKDDELYRLEQVEMQAAVDYEYRKIDPEDIGDAINNLTRATEGKGLSAGKKDNIVIAGSAAEADLVVEIVGRRSWKPFGAITASECWVLFTIGPGPKVGAERFARIPASYRPRRFLLPVWNIFDPTPEKPVFTFEAWSGSGATMACHGTAANNASKAIEKFIDDNYARLTAN